MAKGVKEVFDEYWADDDTKPTELEDAVLEYMADANEEFKALEDKLRVIEETDPAGKTAEHKKIMAQLDKMLSDLQAAIEAEEPIKKQLTLFEKGA